MQASPKQMSFLVVDDDDLLRRGLARYLSRYGVVEVAPSVAGSRELLDRVRVDALITDMQLSDGDGFDVLAHARERNPEILAVILSGSVDAARLSKAFALDVAYLLKPISPTELGQLASRARTRWLKRNARWVQVVINSWVVRYELTPAEEEVLALALDGFSRREIAANRGVTSGTLKKQVQSLLAKTGDSSLESAVNRALRAALEDL